MQRYSMPQGSLKGHFLPIYFISFFFPPYLVFDKDNCLILHLMYSDYKLWHSPSYPHYHVIAAPSPSSMEILEPLITKYM